MLLPSKVYYFMCSNVSLACMCMPGADGKDMGLPGTGVLNSCEPLGRCWELNLGPHKNKCSKLLS